MVKQIKSKERVSSIGEVFTAPREVNAMLDMVKSETKRIDSRFLEPACGEGAFLTEVLRRKLASVKKQYGRSPHDFEKYSLIALTSIYGVDIMEDNAKKCRKNLYKIWHDEYKKKMRNEASEKICDIAKFILKRNILYGDALTMLQNDGKPIIFSEWTFITADMVKRRDYRLDELLEGHDKHKGDQEQLSLFDYSDDDKLKDWIYDEETNAFIPGPIKEYPPVSYYYLDESE